MALATPPVFGGLAQTFLTTPRTGVVTMFYAPALTLPTALIGYNKSWLNAGILKPGSLKVDASKKMHDVKTGIPETIQASFATEAMGKFSCEIIEPKYEATDLINGGDNGFPGFQVAPVADTVGVGGMTVADTILLTTGVAFVVGDKIQVVTPTGNETTRVTAYNTGTKTLTVYPRLSNLAAAGAAVQRIDNWTSAGGTSTIATVALMFAIDCTDQSQRVFYVPKARSAGLKQNTPQGAEMSLPVDFEAYGVTDPNFNGPITCKIIDYNAGQRLSWSA